jgi:hypothetical protein
MDASIKQNVTDTELDHDKTLLSGQVERRMQMMDKLVSSFTAD